MRFPRQSTLFRGPLDPAPIVGVLFLLVLFMLLGSLLYTPGVLVRFDRGTAPETQVLRVTRDGDIILLGKTNTVATLEQLRSGDLKLLPPDRPVTLKADPGADPRLVEQIRELFPVRLPEGDARYLSGTENPTVVVQVNFRGQYFFDNKGVNDRELQLELRGRMADAARTAQKLTMVLWVDEAAENKVVMHLYQLARDVGITDFLLAQRPNVYAPAHRSPVP
jgi:biopolymer transport protein ExbD